MTIVAIAKNTFSEAVRKKILIIFGLVAIALLAFSVSFSQFSPRQELTIVKSFGLGVIAIAGMFMAVVLGINLVPTEVERKTIYTILAKPVRRYEFLLGKFFGALLTIAVNIIMMSALFMVLVTWRHNWQPEWALLSGIWMIFLQLVLLTSVALTFSVFTTPVINFFLTTSVYIVGTLSDITLTLSRDEDRAFIVRSFYWVVHYLTPNFANYFTQNQLIHPEAAPAAGETALYGAWVLLYAVLYTAVLLIVSILVFDRRDM